MKRIRLHLAATTLGLLLAPLAARADFADVEAGARGLAMGGAFVAVEGDPASLYWNPAAIISDERRVQLSGMRTRLYDGVDGLTEDFLGLTFRVTPELGVGVGWTRTGLEDLYHEDLLTAAIAVRLPWLPLTIGASGLLYGVAAPGYEELNDPNYLGSQWESSFSLGALYKVTQNLSVGVSLENLLTPEMALLGTTTDIDEIGGRRRLGASYVLQEIVRLNLEMRHHDYPGYYDDNWSYHGGAESWFNGILALRVGIDDGDFTAGAGLLVRPVRVDFSLITHERLGNTYRAAITVGF